MADDNVKPTRMELLNTKSRLVMAQKGHKLLKQKRDALVLAFFNEVKKAKNLRQQVNERVVEAHKLLALARSVHGDLFVEANALSSRNAPNVTVRTKNIMGVQIPEIESVKIERTLLDRGYSVYGSSAQFDDAVQAFEDALNLVVQLAETETALKKLLKEIEKTNRRVNALEFNIQPRFKETIKHIQDHLNRLESERFFALKVTKKRLQKTAEAEAA
ncbi:hypothetical protein AUJ14_03135 [Candidatus Micrarchaeota archaeon CG1_02_55_22]|nr:MAG: hypothetical protein AUJ14_03135 [Candidatus Micrarchaeota archaeon CG1_02_55_22]